MSEAVELAGLGASAGLAAPARLLRDLVLYGLASAAALAVDWATLAVLVRHGVPTPAAAAVSFMLGMVAVYAASIRLVYADRRQGAKLREATLFVAIGLGGLVLNVILICGFGALFGLSAPVAKAPTAVLVFLFNFMLRRALLFAGPAAA